MSQAKQGDTVRVHYTGKLTDGEVFDSSREREPLQLTIGARQVIPGIERAIEGMAEGETKTVDVPASDAFGPHREEMVLEVQRTNLPDDLSPQIGQSLQLTSQDGQSYAAVVTSISDNSVTMDANHPLAGKDLRFDLELVELV